MYVHYQNEVTPEKSLTWLQRWLSLAIAAVFIAASLLVLVSWYLHSTQLLSVQTGSMAPAIQPGDAVLVEKVGLKTLRIGDVISFHSIGSGQVGPSLITHRIVELDVHKGFIQTRGDNNVTADQPIDVTLIVGRVTRLLPNMGYLLDFVRSRVGLTIGVYVPAAIIVLAELRRLIVYYSPGYRHPSRA